MQRYWSTQRSRHGLYASGTHPMLVARDHCRHCMFGEQVVSLLALSRKPSRTDWRDLPYLESSRSALTAGSDRSSCGIEYLPSDSEASSSGSGLLSSSSEAFCYFSDGCGDGYTSRDSYAIQKTYRLFRTLLRRIPVGPDY